MDNMVGRDFVKAVWESLFSSNEHDRNGEAANVVDGLFAIARSLDYLARSVEKLGVADAMTPMGAIEAFIVEYRSYMGGLVQAVDGLAEATRER